MLEFLLVVVGLLILATLHRRNTALERRLRRLEEIAAGLAVPPTVPTVDAPLASNPSADRPAGTEPDAPGHETVAEPPAPEASVSPAPPPPSRGGFEEQFGTRWAVWIGGVALGLGGIFLVRYTIEQGMLGPRVRVALGLLFALALIAAGEWLRRRERPLAVAAFGRANVPAVLTAAGTSTAFAAIYAAYALYGLIGPTLAFAALGAVSFVTMAAAILHGPALAGFGLVAALGSPLLLDTRDPSPFALVLYLAFATGASFGVARIRLWRALAVATASGAILWGFMLLFGGDVGRAALVAHVLIQLALALLFLAYDPYRGALPQEMRIDALATKVLFWFAILAALAGVDAGSGLARSVFVGTVVAMMAAAAIRVPAVAGALAAAGVAVLGTLALWPVRLEASREPDRIVRDLAGAPYPDAVATFIAAAVVLTAIVAAAAVLRLGYGRRLRLPAAAWYAGAATLTPLAALVLAYWRLASFDHSIPFAVVAGGLALGFAVVASWLRARDAALDNRVLALGLGATASAAVAALAAGLTFALDRGALTVALALSALGTAWIADRVGVTLLRWTVAALGAVVAARLAWDPSVMRGEIGATPILNWLLWGYGVPAASFVAASRILRRTATDNVVRFTEGLGYVFAALLVFLQTRHALHAGDPFASSASHLEAGLVVTEALAFTALMARLDLARPDPLYRYGSLAFGFSALLGATATLGLRYNPYLSGETVIGGPLFNSLLLAYLVPAIMAAAVAQVARANRPRPFVLAAAALSLGLGLAYAALEIRRLFHPDGRIGFLASTGEGELWSYSLALLVGGLALLAIGIARRLRVARRAALVCLLAAVLKVFLVDMSALQGLTRALSFVGLGATLILIGLVYQRLVAAPSKDA